MDSQNELFALCKKTGGTYMAYELRPYQKECKDILDKTPTGNHLVVMATGLGKTVVMTHLKRNGRVLLLSHRDELVRQPEKYFDCSFGIEKAEEHAGDEEVVSASVQSLSRPGRMKRFAPDAFDTIIIDEAHHSAAKSYRAVLDYFSGAKRRIGFTATPQRGDNVRLTDVFDDIIFNRDLRWGIQNNYLSRIRCEQVFGKFKLKNVKKHLGDYSDSDLEKVMLDGDAIVTAAKAYVEKCLDRHTLIYCVTKRLCYLLRETICSLIPDKKDTVCVVTGETPAEERRQILKDFADGKIRGIINCMVLTEGTDLPICDTIMNLRPTCNPTLYQQMAGRGTRLYEGKEFCLLIDIVPADSKKVQNLCTAPTLFGVDPALLDKEQKKKLNPDTDLLTLCDSLRGYFTTEAQRMEIETRRVDLFLDSCNDVPVASKRYAIANEIAQYIFHKEDKKIYKNYFVMPMCPTKSDALVAEIFSIFLLIPMRNFLQELYDYVKYRIKEQSIPISTEEWIKYLSEKTGVSEYYVANGYQYLRSVAYWIYQAWELKNTPEKLAEINMTEENQQEICKWISEKDFSKLKDLIFQNE